MSYFVFASSNHSGRGFKERVTKPDSFKSGWRFETVFEIGLRIGSILKAIRKSLELSSIIAM